MAVRGRDDVAQVAGAVHVAVPVPVPAETKVSPHQHNIAQSPPGCNVFMSCPRSSGASPYNMSMSIKSALNKIV